MSRPLGAATMVCSYYPQYQSSAVDGRESNSQAKPVISRALHHAVSSNASRRPRHTAGDPARHFQPLREGAGYV